MKISMYAAICAALSPFAAHAHDDGKGQIIMPAFEFLLEEFSNVAGANANPASNAPQGHAPCINGMAAGVYPCDGIDMLSHLTLDDLGFTFVNDMWGWTDPVTKRDYALVGGAEGMTIVDISDPKRPVVIGQLPARFSQSLVFWRDIKVYKDHAFIVAEDLGSGLQVFDLTEVRNYLGTPMTFASTATYDGYDHSHNIAINEDTGYAYVIGSDTCEGGLHMIDISSPTNPVFAGCGSTFGYIHDTQCVVYEGPDTNYVGREICFNSATNDLGGPFSPDRFESVLDIVDVTVKGAPVQLGRVEYPLDGYSHQGWLSNDQAYFFHNDELDELFRGSNTSTRIFDVSDLNNPVLVREVDHGTGAIGHNAYTEGDYLYASNYTSGLRVYDTGIAGDGELPELVWFDMYPENDLASFEGGTWSNYPYFRQKKIVAASSMERGLFILQPRLGN